MFLLPNIDKPDVHICKTTCLSYVMQLFDTIDCWFYK